MRNDKDGKINEESLLSHVAWLYFIGGLTQNEIAVQLGTTRLRINKALGAARDEGIVQIDISSPFTATYELEKQLIDAYSLRGARVGISPVNTEDSHHTVGTALAYYLNDQLAQKKCKKIGVSWGATLECAVSNLKAQERSDIEIVSLMGGLSKGTSINTFGIASSFASRLSAQYYLFAAPIYSETAESARTLLDSTLLTAQIEKALNVDIAILVVGDLSKKSLLIREGLPKGITIADLKARGAVGDILGRFLDKNGLLIDHPINDCAISPPHTSICQFKHSVLAAAGTHKVPVIHAALKTGYIHTLITDSATAMKLLKYAA